uniref:BEN domain-containing protein n=1 Tax=Trichogramma kaykai TaxID=54128 RepID=A0ABD2WX58_9HYME
MDRSVSRSRSESFEHQPIRSRSRSRSRPRPRALPINVERWDEEIHQEFEYDVNFPYLHQFHPKLYYYYKENELLVPPEVPNLHPRYAEVDGKIYLGLRVFAKKDAWQSTRMVKRFGIFCRNLAVILWGGEKLLANKSIYPSDKIINPDWGERTIICPQKLELYFSLVDDFINEKMPGTSETKRYDYLHGLTQRICRKIQDIRDALDPNKKKQKKQGKRRNQRK